DKETSTVDFPQVTTAGNIKISVVVPNPNAVTVTDPFNFQTIDVYAAYANTAGGFAGEFLGTVATGGTLGTFGNLETSYAAGAPNINAADVLDEYDLSIFTPEGTNVYIGT